jgi:hypothetical protein
MSAAEREEMEVNKRRAEGTPCTKESFDLWKQKFDLEMLEQQRMEKENSNGNKQESNKRVVPKGAAPPTADKANRLTGHQYFRDTTVNLEALELAAEQAGEQEEDDDENDDVAGVVLNAELFDDDEDLDDLDFDEDDVDI